MIFDKAIRTVRNTVTPETAQELLLTDPLGWRHPGLEDLGSTSAMKIAAVSACIEIRSDSIAKMPFFVMDNSTRTHKTDHYLNYLLTVRPNPKMTPYTLKKLVEVDRLTYGNAYILIVRSGKNGVPIELLHMNPANVTPVLDEKTGELFYRYWDRKRKVKRYLEQDQVIHLKGYSEDGIIGLVKAGELQPDVLLVDLLLPGVDGATLISRLRAYPRFQHSHLIVVTSLDAEQRASYVMALADVPVVHKPHLVQDLPDLLRACMA